MNINKIFDAAVAKHKISEATVVDGAPKSAYTDLRILAANVQIAAEDFSQVMQSINNTIAAAEKLTFYYEKTNNQS